MSDTPPDATVPLPASDGGPGESAAEKKRPGRLGPLPIWLWIVLAAILVILLVILGVALFAGGGRAGATGSPTPTASSASPTPSPTPTASATATPTPSSDPHLAQGTFDSSMDDYMASVLDSQNTAVLSEGGTFSNPVFVLAANSDLTQNMTPDEAVNSMQFMLTPLDPNPWDLALPETTLAGYRAGPFGSYFPVGAIVARSHDGHVFSFLGHDQTITTMFMAASEDLLH